MMNPSLQRLLLLLFILAASCKAESLRNHHDARMLLKHDDYSVHFERCIHIGNDDPNEMLGEDVPDSQYFVLYRECYNNNKPPNCEERYAVDLETYLEMSVALVEERFDAMCDACDDCESDCDECYNECQKIEFMEEYGYIDATEFIECQMIYDGDDDDEIAYYAGAICAGADKITIGVFRDEDCRVLDPSKQVDDYLVDGEGHHMKLSHAMLKQTYATAEDACLACATLPEMCQGLSLESFACVRDETESEPVFLMGPEEAEATVCDLIVSLKLDDD